MAAGAAGFRADVIRVFIFVDQIGLTIMLSFPYLTRMTRITKTTYPDFPKTVLTPDVDFLKEVMP